MSRINIRSGKNFSNTLNRGLSRFASVIERVRSGMLAALRRPSLAGANGVDLLEPRRLFSVTLEAGEFTLLGGAAAARAAGAVSFVSDVAGSTAQIVSTAGGINGAVTVNLNGLASGATANITLTSSLALSGGVTFTNYTPGATINLTLVIGTVVDGDGATDGLQVTGQTFEADPAYTGAAVGDALNSGNFTAAANSNVAGVTFLALNGGGNIALNNTTGGGFATVTVPNTLLGATDLTFTVTGPATDFSIGNVVFDNAGDLVIDTAAGNLGNVTVGGIAYTTTANDANLVIDATADLGNVVLGTVAAVGNAAGSDISVVGVNTGTVTVGNVLNTSTGNLGITLSSTGNNGNLSFGNVTGTNASTTTIAVNSTGNVGTVGVGNLAASGTATVNFGLQNGGNAGAVTIGTVTTTETATGSVTIDANGNVGGVSVGALTASGDNAGNGSTLNVSVENNGTTASVTVASISVSEEAQGSLAVTNDVDSLTGGFTVSGATTLTSDNAFPITVNPGGNLGNVSFGAITNKNATGVTGVSQNNTITISPNGNIGTVNFGALDTGDGTEGDSLTINVDPAGADQSVGAVTFSTLAVAGNLTVNVVTDGNGTIGNLAFGTATVAANGGIDLNVAANGTGTVGTTTLGAIGLGDSATYTYDIDNTAGSGGAGNVSVGAVTVGDNASAAVRINTAGAGSIGTFTAAAAVVGNGGGLIFTANAAGTGNLGDVTLGALTVGNANGGGNADLTFAGADLGNVAISGLWNIRGATTLNATSTAAASANDIGTVGGNAWDIDVQESAGLTVNLTSQNGIGQVTIASSDLIADANANNPGTFGFNATADNDNNSTGAFTGLAVLNAGDNYPDIPAAKNTGPEQRAISSANIVGTSVGNIQVAGSVTNFNVTARNETDTGAIGTLTLGQTSTGVAVPDSYSDTVSLVAEAGVGAIVVNGDRSVLIGLSVNANNDNDVSNVAANTIGSLGTITVTGQGGFDSLTLNGDLQGVSLGAITVTNGNFNTNGSDLIARLNTGNTTLAQRAATISSVGNITVVNGSLNVDNILSDDNVGNIIVTSLDPSVGNIDINSIEADLDADVALAGTLGGSVGNISAGDVDINTIDTNTLNTTNFASGNSVGTIVATWNDIDVSNVDVAGNFGQVTASDNLDFADGGGNYRVNGNIAGLATDGVGTSLDNDIEIATNGSTLRVGGNLGPITGGLEANDQVEIGTIDVFGSAANVNAGLGDLDILSLRVRTAAADGTTPAVIFTGGYNDGSGLAATDFILDFRGGTATFDYSASIDSSGGNGGLTVNDILAGSSTSAANTRFALATRDARDAGGVLKNYATNGLGVDDSIATFNLSGFFITNTLVKPSAAYNSFRSIAVEGSLTGPMGNDSNANDGTANTLLPSNFEDILGDIGSLVITGNWDASNTIFVRSIQSFSFGTITNGDGNSPVGFSYDAANVGFNGSETPGGNVNGNQSLEIYSALAASNVTDLPISIVDGSDANYIFVGPGNALELFRFSDRSTDGIVNTAVVTITNGVFGAINLFGENFGLQYNASNNANPATTSATTITYGVARNTPIGNFLPTNVSSNFENAIEYIALSGSLGGLTVVDADVPGTVTNEATDANILGIGNVYLGYAVNNPFNGGTQYPATPSTDNFISDNNDGNGPSGIALRVTPAGVITRGNLGAVNVQGYVGGFAVSGNIASITTTDPTVAARVTANPTSNARFGNAAVNDSIVADGTIGAISVEGTVFNSIVAGDQTVTALGTDNALFGGGTAADTVGTLIADGAQAFLGNITVVGGNLGDDSGNVNGTVTPNVSTGDRVSAPFGINIAISVLPFSGLRGVDIDGFGNNQGQIRSAIVSGFQTNFLTGVSQESDDISGSITAVDITGDIWSGDDISAPITARSIAEFAVDAAAVAAANVNTINASGYLGSFGGNGNLRIIATGGSPGDITGNITAAGNISNVTIQAGTGTGGAVLANIIAGTDGTGGITGTNTLQADDSIGSGNTHFVSAANSISFQNVTAGAQTTASVGNAVDGGSVNSDFAAGVLINLASPTTTVPVTGNFNSSTLPLFTNANADITITTLTAGNLANTGADTVILGSNVNGTFAAGRNVTISTLNVDGDVIGNDGTAGGHFIASNLGAFGSIGASSATGVNITGGTVVGNLAGYITAGTFASANLANSPFQANDLGIVPGTVLTYGNVTINLTVGTWNSTSALTLAGLAASPAGSTVSSVVPNFAIAGTGNATVNVFAQGLPFAAPQTGVGSTVANPATGDVSGVNVVAFGSLSGEIRAADSADFGFTASNIDALTAFSDSNANPSGPATNLRLNAANTNGSLGINNALNLRSDGNGTGGTSVDFVLAGFDLFAPGNFANRFGNGSISADVFASDGFVHDGEEVADVTFGFIGAGNDISGDFFGDDDTIAVLGDAALDGSLLVGGFDADIVAGLSARAVRDGLNPANNSSLFAGGNFSGYLGAGDDIGSAGNPVTVAALAGTSGTVNAASNGNISAYFESGYEEQFNDADANKDIFAVIIAANSVTNTVDAGSRFNSTGRTGGSFVGGIHAGAGNDLDINAAGDNIVGGDISATIRTIGDLDVTGFGLLAEDEISGVIGVGYGPNGGNLLGNVIAEGTINEIQVWGNVGTPAAPSLIYSASTINRIGVGNSPFIPSGGFADATSFRPSSMYTGGVGNLNARIFTGGTGSDTSRIYVGGSIAPASVILLGAQNGAAGADLAVSGSRSEIGRSGSARFTLSLLGSNIGTNTNPAAPANGSVDVLWHNGGSIISTNTGTLALGLRDITAADTIGGVTINDGSVRSITVNDDLNGQALLDGLLGTLPVAPTSFTFVANSVAQVSPIVQAFNNTSALAGITGDISVDFNVGAAGTSIGAGLNAARTNYAIFTQGSIGGAISSSSGSIGNIVTGTTFGASVTAYGDIGSVYATTGSISSNFNSQTGSVGFLSALDNVTLNVTAQANFGGAEARTGAISGSEVDVRGSIGFFKASGDITLNLIAETGNVGFDLDTTDGFTPAGTTLAPIGIYSDRGNINNLSIVAGGNVANIQAALGTIAGSVAQMATSNTNLVLGYNPSATSSFTVNTPEQNLYVSSVTSRIIAGGNIGNLTAFGDISNLVIAAGGNVGNVTSTTSRVGGTSRLTINYNSGTAVVEQGALSITAAGTVGNINALKNIGTAPVDLVGGGDVVGGLSVTSNATRTIDPVTLELTTLPLDPTQSSGIGNVFSNTGDVRGTFLTSGNIGFSGSGGAVVGGIAAPLGTVDVSVNAAGVIGGIKGKTTVISPDSSFGSIGNASNEDGTYTVNVTSADPLVVTVGGTTYFVRFVAANGTVTYTVAGDSVTFGNISLTTTGPGARVEVITTAGDRNDVLSGEASRELSLVRTTVSNLSVNATTAPLNGVVIDGDLLSASVSGNLTQNSGTTVFAADGRFVVEGSLGTLAVTGNIGSAKAANVFTATGMTFNIGSGRFDSLTAGGTNFGLQTVALTSGQYVSWSNTLASTTDNAFLNAYIRSGGATLTINNGYLENVTLNSGSTSGLVVYASPTAAEGTAAANNATPTSKFSRNGGNRDTDKALADIASGKTALTGGNAANVGVIEGVGLKSARLSNLVVEGSLDILKVPSVNSTLSNITIYGDLGESVTSARISNIDIRNNLGRLVGGTISQLLVSGNAGSVTGSTITNSRIVGNVGTLSAGQSLVNTRVVGSALKITAQSASNLSVGGSIGAAVSGGGTLGSVFSQAQIDEVLGTSSVNDADEGANGVKYVGGIFVSGTARNIAIAGQIADSVFGRLVNSPAQALVGQTIDDSYIGVASNRSFFKKDGVVVQTPDTRIATLDIPGLAEFLATL